MHVVVIAVGRLKQGPERDLAERYLGRATDLGRRLGIRSVSVHELAESRAREAQSRIADEATQIAALIPEGSTVVALDERGKNIGSDDIARAFGQWRDTGVGTLVFVIGGADGLSPDFARRADLKLAFGAATWPHQMVRIMVMEQIYRALTILAGHPYHRA